MTALRQKGSIIVYILIAIFLTGLLVTAMTQGSKKSASSEQVDELMLYLQLDIKNIQAGVDECAETYSSPVTGLTNPNIPFPLYHDLSYGAAGEPIATIKCPGAPAVHQPVFGTNASNDFKVLNDPANYDTTYFSDGTEGVYLRIARTISDPVWTEAISRLSQPVGSADTKISPCASATVASGGTDPYGYVCTNGCLYYWILRRSTSSPAFKASCP